MANGSCLDDKGRKSKMREKNKDFLFKHLGNTLCFPSFPSWGGRQQQDKRSGGSIQSRTPCLLPGDLSGCVPPGRMPEMGDTEDVLPVPADARACPKKLDISEQKAIQTLRQQGSHSNQ